MRPSDDWDGAVCAQVGAAIADEIFFPSGPDQAKQAVAMCWACPLRQICLERALDEEAGLPLDQRFGIRGGLTATQRTATGRLCPDCGTPVTTKSLHCDTDRDLRARAHRSEYERERRLAA